MPDETMPPHGYISCKTQTNLKLKGVETNTIIRTRAISIMSNLDNLIKEQNERKRRISKDNGPAGRSLLKIPKDAEKGFPLLRVDEQYFSFEDLIVTEEVKESLGQIIVENRSAAKLLSYGLEPKNKILFCGPPGTGKTLSAKIISSTMGYPFVYVLFDSILSSYLGETATNLRKIFDFIETGKFVVLFDEFDIVGKKRDDPHEHGEIKRVVNNFIQMLDNYEGSSIILAATNHQHLLDKAVWRRFDDIIYFDLPDNSRRKQLFEKYLRVLRRENNFTRDQLARRTRGYSAADIAQICKEALKKSVINNDKIVSRDHIMWAISEQKRRKKTITNGN